MSLPPIILFIKSVFFYKTLAAGLAMVRLPALREGLHHASSDQTQMLCELNHKLDAISENCRSFAAPRKCWHEGIDFVYKAIRLQARTGGMSMNLAVWIHH